MPFIKEFYYQLSGAPEGRKWVFLHGLMGFANNWQKVIHYLAPTEYCLSYDQRGHGRSPKPSTGYSVEDYAQDLETIINELGWQKIILVGHSMGGRNGLHFCYKHPDRIEKFVLVDISPNSKPENYLYFKSLLDIVPTPFANRADAKIFFQEKFPMLAKTRDSMEMVAAYLYTNLIEKNDGTWDWRFDKNAIIETARLSGSGDRWHELVDLKTPTLLMRGENSNDLLKSDYQKMLESNKLIQGVEIQGAGHWIHAEQPLKFVEALRNFVN